MEFLTRRSFWIVSIVFSCFSFGIAYFATYFLGLNKGSSEFANISVLIGSVSTAITFLFLILQNIKIREQQEAANKRQEEAEKRQEQFEKQQKELWDSQQVKIQFEMYQAHKREFFRVLDDIEKSATIDIEFYNRETLYRRVFPMNNFSQVDLKIEINDSRKYDLVNFTDIHDAFKSSIDDLNTFITSSKSVEKNTEDVKFFIFRLLRLSEKLQLTIKPTGRFGDVSYDGKLLINAYAFDETINIFSHAFEGISAFSGNNNISSLAVFNMSNTQYLLQDLVFSIVPRHKEFNFNIDPNSYAVALHNLYKFYRKMDLTNADTRSYLLEFKELSNDLVKTETLVNDTYKLSRLTTRIYNSIRLLEKKKDISKSMFDEFTLIYRGFDTLPYPKFDRITGEKLEYE